MDKIDAILAGSLANTWPGRARARAGDESIPGYVRLDDSGDIRLDTLIDADFDADPHPPLPEFIPVSTPDTGGIILDMVRTNASLRFGGLQASTRSYFAHGFATSVDPARISSTKATRVEAHFPGVSQWAGIRSIERIPHYHKESKRIKSLTIEVKEREPLEAKLSRTSSVELSGYWKYTSQKTDSDTLYAPVSISSISKRPSSWTDHLWTLTAIQDLLCVCHRGFVIASGGQASFEYVDGDELPLSQWWSNRLMRTPNSVRTIEYNAVPKVSLAILGGVGAIRRWLVLRKKFARTLGPMVSRYRFGRPAVELQLIEAAAAIEYYIAAHRRQALWAAKKPNEPLCSPLVRHAGSHFSAWIHDPVSWANKFWSIYNALKHNAAATYDPYEIAVLADSANILLTCVVLDRVAGNKNPSRLICLDERVAHLSRQVADIL